MCTLPYTLHLKKVSHLMFDNNFGKTDFRDSFAK